MGFIHYEPREYDDGDFAGTISLDYYAGRMVKLYPKSLGDGVYQIGEPQYDASDPERTYQSWGAKYPTAQALIEAAGLAVLSEGE
jgi:hypothetical protein